LYRTSWSGSEQQLRRLSSAAADREFDWEVRSSSRWTQQRLERKERCRVENVRCMCYASTPPRNQVSFDVPVIVHESTTVDISLQVWDRRKSIAILSYPHPRLRPHKPFQSGLFVLEDCM
jgi:hypothetical protein